MIIGCILGQKLMLAGARFNFISQREIFLPETVCAFTDSFAMSGNPTSVLLVVKPHF